MCFSIKKTECPGTGNGLNLVIEGVATTYITTTFSSDGASDEGFMYSEEIKLFKHLYTNGCVGVSIRLMGLVLRVSFTLMGVLFGVR
jgi:hypothetical protein